MTGGSGTTPTPVHDAVVLAGGRGRRLGGVSKPEVPVAGVAMIDRVLTATIGARQVVIVGPAALARPGVPTTLERPADGGPVAGIAAGLAALASSPDDEAAVLVLACDVPRAAGALPALFAALAAAPQADGVHLVDADGHPQLIAVYRRAALAGALRRLAADGGVHGVSVRRLAERLTMVPLADPGGHGRDADTWDDVRYLDAVISRGEGVAERQSDQSAPGSDLGRWVQWSGQQLGVDPAGVDVDLLLDLARDVAHGVGRPAVPLTGFLVGYAVGRGSGDRATLERVVARATELIAQWPADGDVPAANASPAADGAKAAGDAKAAP